MKPVTVAMESSEDLPPGFGVVADISVGGACVITDLGLRVGAKARMTLSFPNSQTVLTAGRVRWTQQDPKGVLYGMQFEPGPWIDDRLRSLVTDNTAT